MNENKELQENIINNVNEQNLTDNKTPMEILLQEQKKYETINKDNIKYNLKILQSVLQGVFIITLSLIWICIGFKSFLLCLSIFSILMYVNITTTSLANAFISRGENTIIDIIWRLFFIFVSAIGFGIYYNI